MEIADDSKDTYLTGRILVAMPGMQDPRFHKAVIYMCAHDDKGAMGLVINNSVPGIELGSLMKQLQIEPAGTMGSIRAGQPVMCGGPVEGARGFILHSPEYAQSDTIRIDPSFSVTGTIDALRAIAAGTGPNDMLFVLGYAGWTAGQLEKEIQENVWLVTNADHDLVFSSSAEDKWIHAIRRLGIDPVMLSDSAGHA